MPIMDVDAFKTELQDKLGKDVPLTDNQLSSLMEACGSSEAALKLLTALAEQSPKSDADEDDDDDDGDEKIAYRDEFFDVNTREWRIEKRKATTKKLPRKAKIIVRQRFDEHMQPKEVLVDIRCARLVSVLRGIFRDAEGVNIAGDKMTLEPDYFFWAREYLSKAREHASAKEDAEMVEAIDTALAFVGEYWPDNKVADMVASGQTSFAEIWSVLPPNVLVVGQRYTDDVRVYRVKSHHYYKSCSGQVYRRLVAEYYDFDGKTIGAARDSLLIPEFKGTLPVTQLPFVPLHMHPRRDEIWDTLIARTERQFELFQKPFQVVEHEGSGLITYRDQYEEWTKPQRFKFSGRVMIDPLHMTKTEPEMLIPQVSGMEAEIDTCVRRSSASGKFFDVDNMMKNLKIVDESDKPTEGLRGIRKLSYRDESTYNDYRKIEKQTADGIEQVSCEARVAFKDLSDDQRIMFSGLIYGYGLADSRWGAFSVDNLSPVEWNHNAFESLVMDPELKDMMCGLVKSQNQARLDHDDFVRGKGKGLIGLLYGKPGLGKTLTAEAIAETAETPLFMISSGSLGHTADKISENLTKLLELGAHWRAVLLLDEADVFINSRTDNDLERNAIVSVFLRQLEYYQGILIMTTNRAESIDPAFQSRIHFFYQYPDLDPDARKAIWQTFADKAAAQGGVNISLSSADIAELAALEYNGRQIKNIHSVAAKLAAVSEGRTLTKAGILQTIKTLQNLGPLQAAE